MSQHINPTPKQTDVATLNSNKTDFEIGTFSPTFPRDTATNVYGTWIRIGRVLFITAQWQNAHQSGAGGSYIDKASLPTPTGYRRGYGLHGNWHAYTTDKQGSCGQFSENDNIRFENAGSPIALPDERISMNAWCTLNYA